MRFLFVWSFIIHVYMCFHKKNVLGKRIPHFFPLVKKESPYSQTKLGWKLQYISWKILFNNIFSKKIPTEIINRIKNAD